MLVAGGIETDGRAVVVSKRMPDAVEEQIG